MANDPAVPPYVSVIFAAVCEPGDLLRSEEHDDGVWLTPAEAVKLEISPTYARFIATWAAAKIA